MNHDMSSMVWVNTDPENGLIGKWVPINSACFTSQSSPKPKPTTERGCESFNGLVITQNNLWGKGEWVFLDRRKLSLAQEIFLLDQFNHEYYNNECTDKGDYLVVNVKEWRVSCPDIPYGTVLDDSNLLVTFNDLFILKEDKYG